MEEPLGKEITIYVNGKEVKTRDGAILLPILKDLGIKVPALCFLEGVSSAGACRLCVVEAKYKNWSRVVISCLYPVWDGVQIETDNERVHAVRRLVLETLLARCPNVPLIQRLASEYGIKKPRFKLENHECILCSLCVRVCAEVVGVHALSMQGRGAEKECGTPYLGGESTCIGCGACVYVCPTECIKMEDKDGFRTIWHEEAGVKTSVRRFELKTCKVCGAVIGPKYQIEYISKKTGVPVDYYDLCKTCKALQAKGLLSA